MDKKEIKDLIDRKQSHYYAINNHNTELIRSKTILKEELEKLWLESDWDTIIDGRPTDKTKKAYVDSKSRIYQEGIELIEAKITAEYNLIDIINDKLKYLSGVDE